MELPRVSIMLAAAAAVALLLATAGGAAAESWTLLWSEDFQDASDWHFEAHYTVGTWVYGDGFHLKFAPGPETGQWLGPTYRTAASSLWDDSTSDILRLEISNLSFIDTGGTQNRQWAWVIADSSVNHKPDLADAIGDWFQVKLLNADCCAVVGWNVVVKDDGVEQAEQAFAIASPTDKELYANITINTLQKRFWINWSTQTTSGAHTGTWTGDGPFAETNSNQLNVWGYSTFTSVNMAIDGIALYGNHTDVPAPPPPPPPPTPRGKVHGDFSWVNTSFGVQFHDLSNAPGKLVKWQWDFDDGWGAKSENPMHDYPCKGNFTVTLYLTDEYGNKGNVSKPVLVKESSPTCGILARNDGGLQINASGTWINIPQAFFLVMLVVSGTMIAAGVEIPYISMRVRKLLFVLSFAMMLISFGALTFIT